jgi:hypothetical protein
MFGYGSTVDGTAAMFGYGSTVDWTAAMCAYCSTVDGTAAMCVYGIFITIKQVFISVKWRSILWMETGDCCTVLTVCDG